MEREKVILVTANELLASWCLHELQAMFDLVVVSPEDGKSALCEHDCTCVLLDYFSCPMELYCAIHFQRKYPVVILLDDAASRSPDVCRLFADAICFNTVSPAHALRKLLVSELCDSFVPDGGMETYAGITGIMKRFDAEIKLAATTEETVLLLGESGSGKSWTAKRIHELSSRSRQKFFRVSAADLNPSLIESTLFGTTGGAYTGAVAQEGYFEAANGGTLFLDEIGELPYEMQGKLLNVLETRTFRRLGSSKEYAFDARLIFATNKDLERCVREHTFRLDLFYRINPLSICVPSLRQHPDDIPLLANKIAGSKGKRLTSSALEKLRRYSWPGNIRELENVIIRSCVFSPAGVISAEDIRFSCYA